MVVATLSDGENFGELSLITLAKVKDHSNKMGELHISDRMFGDDMQYQRRKATCLTIEDCDLLTISKELSHQLY